MATNIVLVSVGAILGLFLCFSSYRLKKKPYLYVRNALLFAFGTLFLLTILLGTTNQNTMDGTQTVKTVLENIGFKTMLKKMCKTSAWWETILKLIVPLIAALTTIFLAELPRKAYETVSSLFVIIPLACGLYVSPGVSRTTFLWLTGAYIFALLLIGLLLFRIYLCIEIATVGGLLVAWLIKGFYSLANTTFFIIWAVLAIVGSIITIALASHKDAKLKTKIQSDISENTNPLEQQNTSSKASDKKPNEDLKGE